MLAPRMFRFRVQVRSAMPTKNCPVKYWMGSKKDMVRLKRAAPW
jgi:hypothetical protein